MIVNKLRLGSSVCLRCSICKNLQNNANGKESFEKSSLMISFTKDVCHLSLPLFLRVHR